MSPRPRKSRRQAQLPLLPVPKGFSSLSKAEQVRYLEALWDSISARPGEEFPVPESHLNLAEERLAEYRRDPGHARPARDVLDRLTDRLVDRGIGLLPPYAVYYAVEGGLVVVRCTAHE